MALSDVVFSAGISVLMSFYKITLAMYLSNVIKSEAFAKHLG